MAITITAHHPELTPEYVEELFKWKFGQQYEVGKAVVIVNTDFVMKHSGWSGVAITLRQREGETAIVTKAVIPSMGARLLVSGLIGYIPYFLFGGYGNARRLEKEAIEFVQTAEQFN